MALHILCTDLKTMEVEAIVDVVGESWLKGSAIAAPLKGNPGTVALGPRGTLACRHTIRVKAPLYEGGEEDEEKLLSKCYQNALKLAKKEGFRSVAFPVMGTDLLGFPLELALRLAKAEVSSFLAKAPDMNVYLVLRDQGAWQNSNATISSITQYIRQQEAAQPAPAGKKPAPQRKKGFTAMFPGLTMHFRPQQESFAMLLFSYIDASGMSDSQCYKKAGVDKRVFSRIKSNPSYQPSKPTALAFAIALELDMDQTRELLERAGYALSPAFMMDNIVQYFIDHRRYDIHQINLALYEFNQPLLGAK